MENNQSPTSMENTEQTQEPSPNRPYDTIRQGSVSANIWRNIRTDDQKPFYKVTFQKSYKDKVTGEWREAKSYNMNDMRTLSKLTDIAYDEIAHHQEQDRLARKEPQPEKPVATTKQNFLEKRQARSSSRQNSPTTTKEQT